MMDRRSLLKLAGFAPAANVLPLAAHAQQTGVAAGTPPSTPTPTDYFPADPAMAPFPSPENSTMIFLRGKPGGVPYVRTLNGVIYQWYKDTSGHYVATPDGSMCSISVNGTPSYLPGSGTYAPASQVIIRQGQAYFFFADAGWCAFGHIDVPISGTTKVSLPPAWTTPGGGTNPTPTPPIPSEPPPVSPAPGSTGNTVLAGPSQAIKTLTAAVAAAQPGDRIKLDAGAIFNESVLINKPVVIDGQGAVTNGGKNTASFAGGAVVDGTGLNSYAKGKGGLVITTDCIIKGCEIKQYGMQESAAGLTSGIRNDAAGRFTVEHCYIHDCQVGIGSGGYAATWDIQYTILANCGLGDGMTHNMYISGGGTVRTTISNSTSLSPRGGHAIKVRTPEFTMNGFYVEAADASPIDIPDGTITPIDVRNGTIHKGSTDANHVLLGYAVESSNNGAAGGNLTNVTFDAQCSNPLIGVSAGNLTLTACTFLGNKITGANVVGLPA